MVHLVPANGHSGDYAVRLNIKYQVDEMGWYFLMLSKMTKCNYESFCKMMRGTWGSLGELHIHIICYTLHTHVELPEWNVQNVKCRTSWNIMALTLNQ